MVPIVLVAFHIGFVMVNGAAVVVDFGVVVVDVVDVVIFQSHLFLQRLLRPRLLIYQRQQQLNNQRQQQQQHQNQQQQQQQQQQ